MPVDKREFPVEIVEHARQAQSCGVVQRVRGVMSRCAFFVSAPSVRLLRAIAELDLLPEAQRRKIAATVLAEIKPLFRSRDRDELGRVARLAQDERWRLIASDIRQMADPRFASVVMTEQWVLARLELVRGSSPVAELLAEKRCAGIEAFIRDSLPSESFEIVQLYPGATARRIQQATASRTAA
jgi:hypothetical protein